MVATTRSPLPELLEGGGIFVDPGDGAALEHALRTLLADEPGRRAMGARARERTLRLSWNHSADVVLETLREAVA